jgi:predicted PolB exonuclease-like 3'-5' exonuclease
VLEDWPENKWPPPVCWRVVAIGMLVAHQEMTAKGLTTYVQKSGCITGPEDEIIPKFWQFFDKRQPVLVTWNGRGYDLPVLRQRAFVSAVPTSGWFQAGTRYESYSYRYSANWHCDLMDQLSDYGACLKTDMDRLAKAMGLPGKMNGSGAEIESMFEAGQIEKIAAYCECDVLNLYAIYLRWLLVTGQMDGEPTRIVRRNSPTFCAPTKRRHIMLSFLQNGIVEGTRRQNDAASRLTDPRQAGRPS